MNGPTGRAGPFPWLFPSARLLCRHPGHRNWQGFHETDTLSGPDSGGTRPPHADGWSAGSRRHIERRPRIQPVCAQSVRNPARTRSAVHAAAYGVPRRIRATFVAVCGDPESSAFAASLASPIWAVLCWARSRRTARGVVRTVGPASVEVRVTVNGEEHAFGLSELRRDGSGRGGAGRRSGTSHALPLPRAG